MKRILRNLSVALLCGVLVAPSISAQRRNNGETNGGRIEQRSSSRSSSSRSNRESNNSSRNNNSNRRQNTNSNNRNNSSTSQRPGFNSNNNNRPNNRPDANRPNIGNNNRPNNRPDANRPNMGNNNRPNNRPDANHPNMGNNNRPNNRPDANRPNVGHNGRPNNRPNMNRPGHDFGPNRPVAGHHQHFTPKRPPHRPYRPPMIRPVHRPMPPVGWRPAGRLPIIRGILGLTFGTAINLSLDYLFNNGYTIDGYTNDIVYLRNISALNYIWTDAALYYGNNGFDSSSFYYSSPDYNLTRYNNVYNSLVASYGMPVSVSNSMHSMSATWFGGNNGYITLSFGENTINHRLRYLTTLTFGL